MKSKTTLLAFVLLIGFGLFACQRDESIQTTEYPPPETPAPLPTNGPDTYPSPEMQPVSPPQNDTSFTYPDIEDGGEISWVKAQHLIMQGYVVEVAQTHELKVYLKLKDGRSFITYEPNIDEVFRIVEACGEVCEDVVIATE